MCKLASRMEEKMKEIKVIDKSYNRSYMKIKYLVINKHPNV